MKLSFDIGKVVSSNAINPAPVEVLNQTFPLDNLGLALLFTTATYASKPYSTSVNGQPYNSTTADSPATSVDLARVAVGNTSAYEFASFGGNYTLNRGENNETHQANIETYEAKAEVITLTDLPIKIYDPALSQLSWFRDYLNLTDLFGGSWPDVAIDYNASSLIYRVCFPVWDGLQIVHDPVYVGYLASTSQIPEFPAIIMLPIFALSSLLILALAKARKRNHGKSAFDRKVFSLIGVREVLRRVR